jgi:hypothetical protein
MDASGSGDNFHPAVRHFGRQMDKLSWNGAAASRILPAGRCLCTEIAMRQSNAAALSLLALMIGIAAAAAGAAAARDKANAPAANATSTASPSANATNAKPSAQTSDTLALSDAQRQAAWQDLYMDSLNQSTPPGFDAAVGATVPNTIVIVPVTAQAGSDVPALKPYSFAMVQKKLVIVNPSNRKIADVIAR